MKRFVVICAMVSVVGLWLQPVSGQGWSGWQAGWRDVEIWTRRSGTSSDREVGLGLQLSGASGTVPLAFVGVISSRDSAPPPDELEVRVALGPLVNPNLVRKPVLRFLADGTELRHVAIDLTSRLTVDDLQPSGTFRSGVARLASVDFTKLASADTIAADVLGFAVAFRPDQIDGLKTLAASLHLK